MNVSTRMLLKKALVCCSFGCVALASQRASADIVLLEKDGWVVATNGRINGYLTWVFGEAAPRVADPMDPTVPFDTPNTLVGPQVGLTGVPEFEADPATRRSVSTPRIRSGYASSILGLNITKELAEDLKVLGRFALWSPLSATLPAGAERAKNHEITPSMREHYLEVMGSWGSAFAGRRLSLFSRGHIMLNWNLVHDEGVGHPCNIEGTPQASCGFTGVGSMFANRNAQLGYSTPKFDGFQLTAAIVDPTPMPSADPATNFNRTPAPRFEAEANYDPEFGDAKLFTFVNGMVQSLASSATDQTKTVWGLAGGGRVNIAGFGVGLGAHYGKGLGTATPFSPEWIDPTGELRGFWGILAGANYRFVDTEFALGYGTSRAQETANDTATPTRSLIESASGIALKVAQHIGNVAVSADYMHVMYDWHRGESQRTNVISLGGVFVW